LLAILIIAVFLGWLVLDETLDWRGPYARQAPGRYAPAGHGGALTVIDPARTRTAEDQKLLEGLGTKRNELRTGVGDSALAHYDRVLRQAKRPVILHWLGEMFDPALHGYWGSSDADVAMDTALAVIAAHAAKVDGIKISLLDKDKEIAMRRRLPPGVRMYTGDDFNYAELIAGDGIGKHANQQRSDALLGIFDTIAPVASAALAALAEGDEAGFHEILAPTVPLSRHIFQAPTRFYKTGVVLMAWINGHQDHFVMVGGQQSARSLRHLAELFRLADAAGLLRDPELAVARMGRVLATHGVA